MFHWICPECGHEIAPGVKECPVCEPQANTAQALEIVPAAPIVEPPAPAVKPAVVEQAVEESQTLLHPEVIVRPEVQPKAFIDPTPPVMLDAIPAEARPVVMPDLPLGAVPVELRESLREHSADPQPPPETFADRLADLADLLHGERIPYSAPRIFQESAAPGPRTEGAERTPVILDVTFHGEDTVNGTPARALLAAPPSPLLLAEPQPPSVAGEIPMEAFHPCAADSAIRSVSEAEPCAPGPVQLPDPPNRFAAPALARLQSYHEAAGRLMRPADFVSPAVSAAALPKVTLPGPALPRELMSLQAAGLVPIRSGMRPGPSSRFGWLTYAVVGMLLTAGVATYSVVPRTSACAVAAKPAAPEPAPEPPVPARSANSLASLLEVTGIRFMEVNKRPQIHYLVVNHSSAPLSSVTVYVTLRATNAKPGQAPIARLNFRSPALAAFEAKEMFSSIERATGSVDLPDWQDLRADVDVQ